MKPHLILALFLSCLAAPYLQAQQQNRDPYADLFSLSREDATKRGTVDATNDIKTNTYKILVYGLRVGPSDSETKLKKLGINYTAIAGCIVSEGILGYSEGYNSTMTPFLEKKFGKDIFSENP